MVKSVFVEARRAEFLDGDLPTLAMAQALMREYTEGPRAPDDCLQAKQLELLDMVVKALNWLGSSLDRGPYESADQCRGMHDTLEGALRYVKTLQRQMGGGSQVGE